MTLGRKTLRIAFAACNKNAKLYAQDPAYIYRCDNLAHALQVAGHTVWQGHARDLPWTQIWDVVVFHRPRAQWWMRAQVAWLQRRGTHCVADFDDLVFEPTLAQHSPGVVNGLVPVESTEKQFLSHAQALPLFNAVTVSTQTLADYARSHAQGAEVHVVPNAVHWSWRSMPLYNPVRDSDTMAYMPGTRSHDHDFAWLTPALERTLCTHNSVRLHITGPLTHNLTQWGERVVTEDRKPFPEFAQVFKGVGLNLAPLVSSPFNDCKSGNKVIEAAWWGIPTVFSHLPDAIRLVGAGGVHANTLADFEELLNNWACNPTTFTPEPQTLREAVLQHADIDQVAVSWLKHVVGVSSLEVVCAA
jgi:hypothetical protein